MTVMLSIFWPQGPGIITTIGEYFAQNEFCSEELDEIFEAFARCRPYVGGGGAAVAFAVKRYEPGDEKRTMEQALDLEPPGRGYDDDGEPICTNPGGHSWVTQKGDDIAGEGRSYCEWCGADGDA
jgi:hypothetical protein